MLLDIQKLPTSANSAILLHPKDDVAVARVNIPAGTTLELGASRVTASQNIPAGHKIALHDVATGAVVHRYGHAIGRATQPISAGQALPRDCR